MLRRTYIFIRIHSLDSNNVKKKEHQPWGENATIKYVTVKNTESTNMGLQERGGYTILRKRTPKIHTLSNIDALEKSYYQYYSFTLLTQNVSLVFKIAKVGKKI